MYMTSKAPYMKKVILYIPFHLTTLVFHETSMEIQEHFTGLAANLFIAPNTCFINLNILYNKYTTG